MARGALFYSIGNLLPKVALFLLLPLYVRFMTQAEFGALSLMASIASLLAIANRLGLDQALMRQHFDDEGLEQAVLYRSVAAGSVASTVGVSLVSIVAIALLFPLALPGVPFVPYGVLTILVAAGNGFQFIPTVWLRAREEPGRFLGFAIAMLGASIAVALVALPVLRLALLGGVLTQLAPAVVSVVVAVLLLRALPAVAFSARALRRALAFGLPLLPHQVATWTLNVSDRLLIALLSGLAAIEAQAAIGVYSFGYQIGNVISLIAVSVQAAWTPQLYRLGETAIGPRLHREMFTVATGLFLALAVGVSALAPEIVALIAPRIYAPAVDVIRIVSFGGVCYGLYVMLVGLVMLRRRTAALPVLTGLAAGANVLTNVILIPRIGMIGAAWATLAAFGLYAVATLWYAGRVFPMDLDWRRLGGLTLISAVALAAALVAPQAGVVGWLSGIGIGGVAAAAMWLTVRDAYLDLDRLIDRSASAGPPPALLD